MVIMENFFSPHNRFYELWQEIEKCHLSYLELEESPEKIDQRSKLEEYIHDFLCVAAHSQKFAFQETEEVLQRSASNKKDFSGYKAATGFNAIQLYAGNLLSQPWRKEYRQIKTYCGFYKHQIEANLVGAEMMFEAMGYKHYSDGVLELDGPLCPDRVAAVSRDCLIAYVECQLVKVKFVRLDFVRILKGVDLQCRIEQEEYLNLLLAEMKKSTKKKRVWNKKDHCFFCEIDVLKISRHLLRHHTSEVEVQKILALKVGDKRRKHIFNKLRNQGNFLKSSTEDKVIPIRKPTSNEEQTLSTYLPCKFCKGFYKKKSLFRHVKVCPLKIGQTPKRTNAQADGQSLLAAYKDNDIFRQEIFSSLRADEISLVAKTDPLICAVVRRYLKSHRDKQFRVVASRKMRQLGSLLIELRKKLKSKTLFQMLCPENFDAIVSCTNIISKYNPETETYGVPSLAANMGTLLKECIDAAHTISLKSGSTSDKLQQLTVLKNLIITEWKYEIATVAYSNLQQNKWNKPSLIPLAEDLTLLNINSTTPLNGARSVYKHVRLAGVKNPEAISSTKLRKHLATMSQIINLSPQDLEQLASFMGHTADIHKTYYRLPDDVYQTAKVSKLLLLSEKGQAAMFKGKKLDKIDINLDIEIENSDNEDDGEDNVLDVEHNSKDNEGRFDCNPLTKLIMKAIWEELSTSFKISWLEVLEFRKSHLGGTEQAIKALRYRHHQKQYQEHSRSYPQSSDSYILRCPPVTASSTSPVLPVNHSFPPLSGMSNHHHVGLPPAPQTMPQYVYANGCCANNYPACGAYAYMPYTQPMMKPNVNGYYFSNGYHTPTMSTPNYHHYSVPTGPLIDLELHNDSYDVVDRPSHKPHHMEHINNDLYRIRNNSEVKLNTFSKEDDKDDSQFEDWDYVYRNLESQGYSKDLGERGDVLSPNSQKAPRDTRRIKETNLDEALNNLTITDGPLKVSDAIKRLEQEKKTSPESIRVVRQTSPSSSYDNLTSNDMVKKPALKTTKTASYAKTKSLPREKVQTSCDKQLPNSKTLDTRKSKEEKGTKGKEHNLNETSQPPSSWQCKACTFLNDPSKDICEMCSKSRTTVEQPMEIGGAECSKCTLVNPKNLKICEACGTSLKGSPTYI